MLSRQENVKLDSECGEVTERYKLKCINDNIFKSETSKHAFGFPIQNIQANYETQNEVDVM